MSQYYSRLHIKVSSPKVWKKFEDVDDAGFDLAKLTEKNQTSFVIDGDEWSYVEDELTGIIGALAETLGPDGIIIADTTNINVDPYNYCVFYLGDGVNTDYYSSEEEKCDMHSEASIADIQEWLNYGDFYISKKEKEQLFRCGIAVDNGNFKEFSYDFELPPKVYLRETSFDGRQDNIENTSNGDDIYLKYAKSKYDATRLEVMSEHGSLGYLPSDVSDKIAPFLLEGSLKFTGKVVEIVKLSERNRHAKSPIIAVHIEAVTPNYLKGESSEILKHDMKYLAAMKVK